MKDKFKLETKVGTLEVLTETNSEFPGILIKLDGIPVTFIEQTIKDNEYKLMLKNYDNKKVIVPDDGVNYSKYQIDLEEIEKLKKEINE